jgi:hypothetical protein
MPQLLTNIKAQQQIDYYGSFNDIINWTISRQPKIICVGMRAKISAEGCDNSCVVGCDEGCIVGQLCPIEVWDDGCIEGCEMGCIDGVPEY